MSSKSTLVNIVQGILRQLFAENYLWIYWKKTWRRFSFKLPNQTHVKDYYTIGRPTYTTDISIN